jgi:hypothetical protein
VSSVSFAVLFRLISSVLNHKLSPPRVPHSCSEPFSVVEVSFFVACFIETSFLTRKAAAGILTGRVRLRAVQIAANIYQVRRRHGSG